MGGARTVERLTYCYSVTLKHKNPALLCILAEIWTCIPCNTNSYQNAEALCYENSYSNMELLSYENSLQNFNNYQLKV